MASFSHTYSGRDDGYFTDQLLISTPRLSGSFFDRSVIYIVSHNADGAMGIVINKPINDATVSDVVKQLGLEVSSPDFEIPVYFGGPVEPGKGFIIHTSDYRGNGTIDNGNGISTTSNVEILEDIANGKGPEHMLIALGYAGWSAKQLEVEVYENSWFTVPAEIAMLFKTCDANKWMDASKLIGVNPLMFSDSAGLA